MCLYDPFHYHRLTSIPIWVSNYSHCQVRDEITNPCPNFNGAAVEVWSPRKCICQFSVAYVHPQNDRACVGAERVDKYSLHTEAESTFDMGWYLGIQHISRHTQLNGQSGGLPFIYFDYFIYSNDTCSKGSNQKVINFHNVCLKMALKHNAHHKQCHKNLSYFKVKVGHW